MAQQVPVPTGLIPLNHATADRLKRIAEAAYRRAQNRNFAPGHDLEDWLEAEKEIDAAMQRGPAPQGSKT
jgi:predicted transcriptional regulator